MAADKVALYTYRKMMKNKVLIIPGIFNKIQRLVPSSIKMRIVAKNGH